MFNNTQTKEVITMYEQGFTLIDIAKKLNTNRWFINFLLIEEDIKDFKGDLAKLNKLKDYYEKNKCDVPLKTLVSKFGFAKSFIQYYIKYKFGSESDKKHDLIIEFHKKGLNHSQIQEQTGISRPTIGKVLKIYKQEKITKSFRNNLNNFENKDFFLFMEKFVLSAEMVINANSRSLSDRINNLESKVNEYNELKKKIEV